jgi:CheY-specific phosphatase CheX
MSERFRESLGECFTDVLEKMAFMFTEVVDAADMPETPADGLQAQMRFTGEHTGALTVAFPRHLTVDLAANVIGADPDDANIEELGTDALKEVLNVTCGHVLTTHYGEAPVFDLSVPDVKPISAAEWKKLMATPGSVNAIVDDNPVVLLFTVEG